MREKTEVYYQEQDKGRHGERAVPLIVKSLTIGQASDRGVVV
jgi:hypothetical protein